MNRRATDKLIELFAEVDVDVTVDQYGYLIFDKGPIHVWIEPRPVYCDRGRWAVHAESTDNRRLTIDWADMFPRYYFVNECLVMETHTWLTTRLKNIRPEIPR